MTERILGIHHVTAITGDAQQNVDFYTGVLGLRLVKVTVNYDDPGSYHLYYGDDLGRPGTALTFFAWPGAATLPRERRRGTRLATATAYAVPTGALDFWRDRLGVANVPSEESEIFGEKTLAFEDGDGMALELIESPDAAPRPAWTQGGVDEKHALRGFHRVELTEDSAERTARFLGDVMEWRAADSEGERQRLVIGDGSQPGSRVDVLARPDLQRGGMAPGIVHHVAWRVSDDAAQAFWLAKVRALGGNVSPIMERNYFRSIYFREPGGVLFEIATDTPGFTVDEIAIELGTHLELPMNLAAAREEIERLLPPLRLPGGGKLP